MREAQDPTSGTFRPTEKDRLPTSFLPTAAAAVRCATCCPVCLAKAPRMTLKPTPRLSRTFPYRKYESSQVVPQGGFVGQLRIFLADEYESGAETSRATTTLSWILPSTRRLVMMPICSACSSPNVKLVATHSPSAI